MDFLYGTDMNKHGKIERNKKDKRGKCIIPFKYKRQVHNKCFSTPNGEICATSINDKTGVLTTYGYCYKKNTQKKAPKKKNRKTLKIYKQKIEKNKKNIIKKKQAIQTMSSSTRMNEQLIELMEQLTKIMKSKGEFFRTKAYSDAADAIRLYDGDITDINQLKNTNGIGSTIMKKFKEYVETGKLRAIERERNNPIHLFTEVYGIGPKKAKALVDSGVTTIPQLKSQAEELLTSAQKAGLRHYDDIKKRIPRREIDIYQKKLQDIFDTVAKSTSTMEIVGSYRRGAKNSGDIDIIISDSGNDTTVFGKFLDKLIEKNILIEVLSRGKTKSLGISKLSRKPARRIDFMYTAPEEFPFAILYFTGSKTFNTIMRARALELGYSMNEHGFTIMKNKKKTDKLKKVFPNEKAIFQFLGMKYVEPEKRVGHSAYVLVDESTEEVGETKTRVRKKKKTLKNIKIVSDNSVENIKLYKKRGDIALKSFSESQLSDMIRYANNSYYCNNKSVMTDGQYDLLKEYIEEKYPNNEAIKEGHTQCSVAVEKKKVVLPYAMMSMDKIKPDTKALERYIKTYKSPAQYVRSAKLDGISALYTTENGEPKLYTRGNGREGQDISHAIQFLKLPTEEGITIRGELLMDKNKFKKWSSQFSNVRNMVAGTANAKENFPARWRDIDFVAYEVITPELKPSDQFKWLENHKVITAINDTVKSISNESLSELLIEWRESYPYDIDGVIVEHNKIYPRTNKNPKHAFAFKMVMSDQIVEAPVLDVIWSISKHGYLKPKVRIKPVRIGGAKIEYATAHNAAFIRDNNIGVGAVVQMIRSGDVIPKIHKVIYESDEPQMPSDMSKVKWNETNVDLILRNVEDSSEVTEKKILSFFENLDVVGLGKGNTKKIIAAGFDTLPKILSMSKEDFLLVEGFKEKMATKVYNSIHSKLDKADLIKIMTASNMFGRGMGKNRITAILEAYPDILTKKRTSEKRKQMISQLDGFAQKTASTFVKNIPKFIKFMKDIGMENKMKMRKRVVDENHKLFGKKIVLTGFRDKELQDKLYSVGAKQASSVGSSVFVVLTPDPEADLNKLDTAREKNIPIMTPEAFTKKYL